MKKAKRVLGILVAIIPGSVKATRLLVHSDIQNSSKIEPSINQLKAMITDQQSKIGALQQELAGLLNEVSAGKQAFQESRAGAGPGATVEVRFPAPPPPPPRTTSTAAPAGPEAAGAAGASSVLEGLEPPVMEEPIPVMVVKPDSVADVEEAVTQVMEEQAAMNGAAAAKTMEPQEMIVESPEQQIEDAISKIDQLEAEKTHYKYDMHSVQNSFSQ